GFRADAWKRRAAGDRGGSARLTHAWHAICNAVDWCYGERERRDTMRVKFWVAVAASGFWGLGFGASAALAQQGPIVIGVSTPKTGPLATASEWEMWGVDLALEEINAAGGLLGRKVEVMVLDNKCNPSEGVNVANKLVEAKVVAIEGAHCSSPHL